MKRSPAPIPNSLQAYLRTLFAHPAASLHRQAACANCLRSQRARASTSKGKTYTTTARDFNINRARSNTVLQSRRIQSCGEQKRTFATVIEDPKSTHGPIAEYDERVHSRRLRDDEHQRSELSGDVCFGRSSTDREQLLLKIYKLFTKLSANILLPKLYTLISKNSNQHPSHSSAHCLVMGKTNIRSKAYQRIYRKVYTCTAMWDQGRPC